MLFSAIFIIFSMSACENNEKVIKIGNQAVFSGDDLFYGQDQKISMEIAVSELSPVRIGGFDYRINLVTKDDEGNAEKAFLVAQEFVEENVAAVIGSTFNGTTKASLTVYAEYNIPMLAPCAQAVEVQSGADNFYRMIINNSQKIENIASFLSEDIKPQKLLLIDNGEEYSVKLTDHLIEIFNSRNISFAKRYSVKFDPEQYSVLAENILIDEPDYVFFSANYNEVAQLITKVRELGLSCGFITEEPGMDDGISALASLEHLEGLIAIIPEPPSLAKYSEDKRAIEFWRKYNDYLNRNDEDEIVLTGPGQYAPYSYDAVYLLIDAMKKSNSILPEDFKDKFKSTSLDGVSGKIEFNSNGERLNPLSTVFLMKNGDWVRYSK
jgi:branched-chain amino acid transport system substrate-binding protein